MHTEWKERNRKGDLIAKKEGTDRRGCRGAGASGEGRAVRLEGADIERKRTHRRHYGDKKNGGAKADRSGQSGQSGHLKGQGVDRGVDSRKTFPVYKDSCLHLKTDRAII